MFYALLHELHIRYPGVRGGFIHVPYDLSQVLTAPSAPALPAEVTARGLACAIEAAFGEETGSAGAIR